MSFPFGTRELAGGGGSLRGPVSSYETGSASGRLLREQDVVAELFEAADVVTKGPLRVALREVIGPEVLVGHAALEHVPQGHEHGVLDGDDGLLGTAPRFEAVVERP